MKISDNPDEESMQIYKKLAQSFEPDQLFSLLSSSMGMAHLMSEYLSNNHTPIELPCEVSYAVVQSFSYMRLIWTIFNGSEEEIKMMHMPVAREDDYRLPEDMEERYIFVVKQHYESLKEQGKI